MHGPLLAVRSDAVSRLVPRCSECMQVKVHPSPDPPLPEWFHWVRTLGQVNTTDAQQSPGSGTQLEAGGGRIHCGPGEAFNPGAWWRNLATTSFPMRV